MKNFFKGLFIGAIIILATNFVWGYMGSLTYENVKSGIGFSSKPDTLNDEAINLSIARALQNEYGTDSLMITSIGVQSNIYEYYVSGVKGTTELNGTNRCKKVSFTNGNKVYRVVAVYDCADDGEGNLKTPVIEWRPDESPVVSTSTTVAPEIKPVEVIEPTKPEQKDTVSHNNQDIGEPSNGGSDFNNNSDV